MPKRLGKFELPSKLTKVEDGATPTYAKFIAEPFEAGYGHTVGNSLRRVLLSSIEGAAISSIKIDGVNHEFQSIDGVVEDVTEIVLNLKKVLIVSHKRETISLAIKATKAGAVTAADIQADANIQIVNPEQVICTLDTQADVRGRDRDQDRPRLLPGRAEQEGGAADRGHPDRLALLARQAREVRRREHARRPDHRLRQADPRDLDGRPHHAGRRPQAGRLDPQPPPRRLRPRQRGGLRVREPAERGQRGAEQAPQAPQHVGERDRAVGPRRQLPEQREHHHGRRARHEDRAGDAQVPQLRQEVAERDQGEARGPRASRSA